MLTAACVILAAIAALQIKVIPLGGGEQLIVYMHPFDHSRPGGSANADLYDALVPLYGDEDVRSEGLPCQWEGQDATVYDTSSYDFEYLGRSIDGGQYLLCKVTTVRTVILDADGQEAIPGTQRISTYIGYDDGDTASTKRAEILWDTWEEDYPDGAAYFNSILSRQ